MTNIDSHNHWIIEIGDIIDEENVDNIVKFALSYTLQSLKNDRDEVFSRFKWK